MRGLDKLLLSRRIIQSSILAILPLLPLLGWMRVDVDNGNLTLFGLHVWAHEAVLVVLLAAFAVALLAGFASVLRRLFCGWVCPQTALAEFASFVEEKVRLSLRSGTWSQKLLTVGFGLAAALGTSVIGGISIVSFFVPSSAFAALFGASLNTSLLKGLSVSTILVFVVVFVFRHIWCEWICLFGWLQRLLAGPGSLTVAFDVSRSSLCTNCMSCRRACFMKIEPRSRKLPPTCLNCAKCVSACGREMEALGTASLINLGFYGRVESPPSRVRFAPLIQHKRVLFAAFLVLSTAGALMLVSASRQSVQLVIRQAERLRVDGDNVLGGVYNIDVFNNLSQSVVLNLDQRGLDSSEVQFSPPRLTVDSGQRGQSRLLISAEQETLEPGRHTLTITASSEEGLQRMRVIEGRLVFTVPPMKAGQRNGNVLNAPASIGSASFGW